MTDEQAKELAEKFLKSFLEIKKNLEKGEE